MATLLIRPSAPGDVCTIPKEVGAACPNHYLNVDDVIPDEAATQVFDDCAPEDPLFDSYDLYALQNHTTESGVINFVKVYIRCYGEGPFRWAYTKIKTGGVEYEGGLNEPGAAWDTFSTQYNNKPGGGAWGSDWPLIDAIQAGVKLEGLGDGKDGATVRCTQVYIEVDYTPAPPGGGAVSGNIGHKMIGEGLI